MYKLMSLLIVVLLFLGISSCVKEDTKFFHKVFKYNGSVQCENKGIPLDTMVQVLNSAGIEVICSQEGNDGLARTAVCGAETGKINIYQIKDSDLSESKELGFRSVEELIEYRDTPCK